MEVISPELALVDDEIERSVRPPQTTAPAHSDLTAPDTDRGPTLIRSRRAAGIVVLGIAIAVAATTAIRSDSPVRTDGRGAGPAIADTAPDELRWKPVRGATFYNVILWSDGVRILDLWPQKAFVRLPRERLEAGSYQWFVYPMRGRGEGARYGQVAARGTFEL